MWDVVAIMGNLELIHGNTVAYSVCTLQLVSVCIAYLHTYWCVGSRESTEGESEAYTDVAMEASAKGHR